jgi:tetratricopeptide (TPR) repeat protein
MLYYRGLAEYKTGKPVDAEKTFNAVVKLNPKDSLSLFYLGQISLAKNDLDGAVSALNRATVNDPRMAGAWTLLTSAYLRRAALNAEDTAKADADYLNAVRAGESLIKVRTDEEAVRLFGQALIGAQQYARAAAALDRAAQQSDAKGVTFYLLGVAHSRTKNFPKAIAALQTAATKTPDDVNVYRELGYAYEVTKQYAKALGAYEKGLGLVPDDADFKEAADRVRPFAK